MNIGYDRTGPVFLLVVMLAVFFWNYYKKETPEGSIRPIKPPVIISGECGIEQCHGLDITCGSKVADQCTMEMRIDDFCRGHVRCEKAGSKCQLIKEPQFDGCKSCIERCKRGNDPEKAFKCASDCDTGSS